MALVAVLVAGLAVLMLGGPPASADARLVGQHQAVATADHAVAATPSPGRHRAEALPPARHHHLKPCVLPHRSGGRPLLSPSGRVAMFVESPRRLALLPRWMGDTAAPPGRRPTTYPMRT